MKNKKGQIGVEYLVILAFLTFVTISTLAISMLYSASIKDEIKISQANNFGKKIVSSSENVFYSGEPSKIIIKAYLPEATTNLTIYEKEILIKLETNTGENIISYTSKVPLQGNISSSGGLKRIKITAQQNYVLISEE